MSTALGFENQEESNTHATVPSNVVSYTQFVETFFNYDIPLHVNSSEYVKTK